MGGGLMQLVAYGAQDIYLTGNPQITFFKVVYRRHTNFAMESIEQVFNGSADWNKKVTCVISRNGDLIHKVYLQIKLPVAQVNPGYSFRWLNWLGHVIMRSVEIEIGGQRIDKHWSDWLHIWNELTQTPGHQLGYANMVGNVPQLVNLTTNTNASGSNIQVPVLPPPAQQSIDPNLILYVPLEFWFCRNPGLALPLIALQYHEVKINIDFRNASDCYWCGTVNTAASPTYVTDTTGVGASVGSLQSSSLYVDYIYLDTDERRRFAQVSHEYLIEQLQFTGDESTQNTSNKIKMNFNHPTKELVWVIQPDDNVSNSAPMGKQWFNYTDAYDTTYVPLPATDYAPESQILTGMPAVAAGGFNGAFVNTYFAGGQNPCAWAKIQLNGHDRFSERDGKYFNCVQPYQHHENVPSKGINVYSFALKPEEHQPSGTCNFSRIDSAVLSLTLTQNTITSLSSSNTYRSCKVRIYAVNYNILRVMSGMGGLAYSD